MLYLHQTLEIADMFLDEMNPKRWNGKGNMPYSLNLYIWEYEDEDGDIPGGIHLEMVIDTDDDGKWNTYIDFVDGGCAIVDGNIDTISDSYLIAEAIRSLSWDLDDLLKKGE